VSRNVLKGIVKECLIEILSEGISVPEPTKLNKTNNRSGRISSSRSAGMPSLDKIVLGAPEPARSSNPNFDKNINETTQRMTSDPVLSSILADTAKTTLQEQMGADRRGPGGVSLPTISAGDAAARAVSHSDPQDLFGESADKWESLAFSNSVKRS
jgi:hypothetical protein